MNATQAIEKTVQARIEELNTGKRKFGCPLCEYSDSMPSKYNFDICNYCPAKKLSELGCPEEDNYFHDDPEMGVSYILALQYYWEHPDEWKALNKE